MWKNHASPSLGPNKSGGSTTSTVENSSELLLVMVIHVTVSVKRRLAPMDREKY